MALVSHVSACLISVARSLTTAIGNSMFCNRVEYKNTYEYTAISIKTVNVSIKRDDYQFFIEWAFECLVISKTTSFFPIAFIFMPEM